MPDKARRVTLTIRWPTGFRSYWWPSFHLACLLLLTVGVWPQAQRISFRQPIALAFQPEVGLVVLGLDGTVTILGSDHQSGGLPQLSVKQTFHISFAETPADITFGKQPDGIYIFVSSNMPGAIGGGRNGHVTQYTLDGKMKNMWTMTGIASGIAFDWSKSYLYFVSVMPGGTSRPTNEIFKLSMAGERPPASPSFVGQVPSVMQLGPIALDPTTQAIWCGDVVEDGLAVFDIAARRSHATRLDHGTISDVVGLYFDVGLNRLYATDFGRNKVFAFTPQPANLRSELPILQAKNPSSVVGIENGIIVVADQTDNVLLVFSPNQTTPTTIGGTGR